MKIKILFTIMFFTIFSSCGFKIVDQDYFKGYKFAQTNITGDKRIVYLLKNKLKQGDKSAKRSLIINISIEQQKDIKEKNIQNEITKYEITVTAKVDFNVIENNNSGEFIISKNGDFNVNKRYSDTLNNEKKIIKNIINEISKQIIKNLSIKLNEL
tara:strand:- start:735 stop:1202 length:468 start_codon:yes stop_codon:yes gene_type:complete